jgi:hypothetical protein
MYWTQTEIYDISIKHDELQKLKKHNVSVMYLYILLINKKTI